MPDDWRLEFCQTSRPQLGVEIAVQPRLAAAPALASLGTTPLRPGALACEECEQHEGARSSACLEGLGSILFRLEEHRVRPPERIGICLDTGHLLAAGYDIRTSRGYRNTLSEFHRLAGAEPILAFHVNDSRKVLGNRVDRHEHIGEGSIGLEAFRCRVNDRRFRGVPEILEAPRGKHLAEDRVKLAALRELVRCRWQQDY